MPRITHEQTINTALGEVLEELGHEWSVNSEHIGGRRMSEKRPFRKDSAVNGTRYCQEMTRCDEFASAGASPTPAGHITLA